MGAERCDLRNQRHRQSTHPLPRRSGPAFSPSPATSTIQPLWSATSTRCGIPATSRTSKLQREQTPKGWRIIVHVKEKPTIREILIRVLVRFRRATCSIVQGATRSDWCWRASTIRRIKKAEVSIKELLGRAWPQFATIRTEVRQIPPAAVADYVRRERRPQGQGRQDQVRGQQGHQASALLRSAMKNLKPIGIPHSIFLENLFARPTTPPS